jgi:asparagine synthetase B (glutamine-hydrolysing)
MTPILTYNLDQEAINASLYTKKRTACFAGVYLTNNGHLVCRDHLGTVPLYYRKEKTDWRFAFTMSDLIKQGDTVNEHAVKHNLIFGTSKLDPLVNEIGIVPPGTIMKFYKSKKEILYQYRFIPRPEQRSSMSDRVNKFDQLFTSALQRQTTGYNEIALYLSGGIDSALIGKKLTMMGKKINAYTVNAWGGNNQEVEYAKENSRLFNANKHIIFCPKPNNNFRSKLLQIYKDPHNTDPANAVSQLWHQNRNSQVKRLLCMDKIVIHPFVRLILKTIFIG